MPDKSFKQAFAEARAKFRKDPTEGNYTFTWEGKKYNILQEGETKKSVMEKYGKSSAPDKSPRPRARPSKSESSGSSSSGPKKRLGDEPNPDTTDDARASRGSGRTSDKPKDSRTQRERDRERMGSTLGKIKDFLFPGRDYAKVPIGEWKPEKKYKGGMVGASNPPTQKGTPRYKK